MPSKTKKNSKIQSRLSHSDQSVSLSTPLSSTRPTDSAVCEDELLSSLEEFTSKYLIGKSAFIGRVADVDPESRGCKIWLSESSMVASSLTPGSIVSVSLASSRKKMSNNFPLSSLSDECASFSEVECGDKMAKKVGNYFALATVFPSYKVLKNGVRLSLNLSYTMGSPAVGKIVFVYPIQSQSLNDLRNGNDMLHKAAGSCVSLHNCKELYLELVSSNSRLAVSNDMFPIKCSAETSPDGSGNGVVSSPKTPMYHSKLSSSNNKQLASPILKESLSSSPNPNWTFCDSFDAREILGDESAKKLLQTCATSWLNTRTLLCGNIVTIPILSELCIFRVIGANELLIDSDDQDLTDKKTNGLLAHAPESVNHADDAFVIGHETKVYLYLPLQAPLKSGLSHVEFEHKDVSVDVGGDLSRLGGLSKEYSILKDIIISSMKDTLSSLGLRTTKGVLLHGPPGTGKTSLARLCTHDTGVNFFSVNGPEIVNQYYGESEKALHEVFDSASQAVPAVVFIDELDAIAPARKDGSEDLSQRLVATLLNLMDGISRTEGLLVIAATNRPDSIEPALRRPGRLDREIEIGVPSPKQRLDILVTLLSEMEHGLSDVQVQQLATATHGFVGADLAALCNEAALVCLRGYIKLKKSCIDLHSSRTSFMYEGCSDGEVEGSPTSAGLRGTVVENIGKIQNEEGTCGMEEEFVLKVTFEDFEKARIKVRPSTMREVILEVPKVKWEDVGGQKEVKTQLMEAVEWPQKHEDAFKRIGTRPPRGVLLFGPPGCSKTLMARAVASEAGLNFLAVKGPELLSKWVGESEKAVRSLFAKARANAPSIIFFDEIDGLAVIRGKESDGVSVADRVMSQLLVELDGLQQRVNVTVIAATNRPDKIDPALLRPGRFDRLLYVGPPNESDRADIFGIHLNKIPCSYDVSISELASLTHGCTGADISLLCREAAVAALQETLDASEITMKHLKTAIRQVQPSEIESYQELSAKFQRLVHSDAQRDVLRYNQPGSGGLNTISFWSLIKSIVLHPCRFLATISRW